MSLIKKILIITAVEVVLIAGWFLFVDVSNRPEPIEKITEAVKPEKEENAPSETEIEEENVTEAEENTSKQQEPAQSSGIVQLSGVSFTPQAPFGNWSDSRQQDGCEEAAAIMAVKWARGESLSRSQAEALITGISDWELEKYGEYRDISARDTVNWIIKDYFGHNNAEVKYGITAQDIINELEKGNIVIVPTDGRLLFNPNFTPPGPERHMFPIKGYDYDRGEFIVNDNGTRNGESYRYGKNTLYNAIIDYSTGYHEPVTSASKVMIVVRPAQ